MITQDGNDTLIDFRAHGCGTIRLKNFSVYQIDEIDPQDIEDFMNIYSVLASDGDDTLIDLSASGRGTVRLKNFSFDNLRHGEDFVFDVETEEPDDM